MLSACRILLRLSGVKSYLWWSLLTVNWEEHICSKFQASISENLMLVIALTRIISTNHILLKKKKNRLLYVVCSEINLIRKKECVLEQTPVYSSLAERFKLSWLWHKCMFQKMERNRWELWTNPAELIPLLLFLLFSFIHIKHFSHFEVVQLSLTHASRYFTLDSYCRNNVYEIKFLKELLLQ